MDQQDHRPGADRVLAVIRDLSFCRTVGQQA
jgi:hypothetical protein